MSSTRWLVGVLAVALAAPATGCSKKKGEDTAEGGKSAASKSAAASLVEHFERGAIAWTVNADGQVLARIQDGDGADISRDAKGTIEWSEGENTQRAALKWSEEHDALVAHGPALEKDLTEIRYTMTAAGEPVEGALHVPADGTEAIAVDAKASANVSVDGVVAPHGGVVQVVGDDRVEIVADDDSDEVRVYVLDASWKPVVVGDRKITIAVGGPKPEVVVLTPSPDGVYFVGHWHVVGDPPRVTIVVRRAGKARVAIVGWHPGAKLVVGGGPRVKVKVKAVAWGGPHVKVKVGGPHLKIDVKEKGPKGKVKIKFK